MKKNSNFLGTRPITCHSFNHDQSQVALSLNDEVIYIFKSEGNGKWSKIAELREHTGKVSIWFYKNQNK